MYRSQYPNRLDMPLGLSMAIAQNPCAFSLFAELTPAQRETLAGRLGSRRAELSDCCGGELFHDMRRPPEYGGFR